MALFSVPIFFIVFRETLEAAIIVSVLLGLVEQITRPRVQKDGLFVHDWRDPNHLDQDPEKNDENGNSLPENTVSLANETAEIDADKLIKKLRIQVSLSLPDCLRVSFN